MNEQGKLLLAIFLSLLIILGFQYLFEAPKMKEAAEKQKVSESDSFAPQNNLDNLENNKKEYMNLDSALNEDKRILIQTEKLKGSISLKGIKFDHLILKDYKESLDQESNYISILKPPNTKGGYFSNFGWITSSNNIDMPDDQTIWSSDSKILNANSTIKLEWENPQNVKFIQEISIDENYMFTIKQTVQNNSVNSINLNSVAKISRNETPKTLGFFILHEGPLGVVNDVLEELDYKELRKNVSPKEYTSKGGWFGITDKYWLISIIPDQKSNVKARYQFYKKNNREKYQIDFMTNRIEVPSMQASTITNYLYAGAKEVKLLDNYEEKYEISRFDLAIDFGWFYFLTKPFFYLLIFFNNFFGNFGLSIIFVTLLIKLVFYPFANKSYISTQRMKDLQPEMMRIRETHKNDKMKMNQEVMALYKREKVNPAAGCLPLLIQIPVFFALYKVLFVSIEMRHAPFYLWVNDLSAADPTSILNLFGLLPYDPNFLPKFLNIGLWPILMGLTMWAQQELNPKPADPMQQKIFMFLPIFFTFILAPFPAGLVLYWTINNILSMAQQLMIRNRLRKNNK